MELYQRLLWDVPAQRFSVPLLLHCMLEQVSSAERRVVAADARLGSGFIITWN